MHHDPEAPSITLCGALPLALRRAYAEAEDQGAAVNTETGCTDGHTLDLARIVAAALSEVWDACHGHLDPNADPCPPLPQAASGLITETWERLRVATSVR